MVKPGWLRQFLGIGSFHRRFDHREAALVRRVAAKPGARFEAVRKNPGVRVEPDFIDAGTAVALEAEVRRVVAQYGCSHNVDDDRRAFYERQHAHLGDRAPVVNMRRVTGRDESPTQEKAPWGYGDDFNASRLPPVLRALAEQIGRCDSFALGALRDVTINARHGGFFRLDAHVDPLDDGANVFILGLASDTVLTLTQVGPPVSTLAEPRTVSLASWDPGNDLDVLARQRTLVHLSGNARTVLNHGTRLGVTKDQLRAYDVEADGKDDDDDDDTQFYDWFGSLHSPVPRAEERLSVVYAFAHSGGHYIPGAH